MRLLSVEYVKVDVAVSLKMPEKLIHLVVGVDGNSFLVGFLFSKLLFDGTDVGVLEGLFKYLLHKSGDNSALQTKEFAYIRDIQLFA